MIYIVFIEVLIILYFQVKQIHWSSYGRGYGIRLPVAASVTGPNDIVKNDETGVLNEDLLTACLKLITYAEKKYRTFKILLG